MLSVHKTAAAGYPNADYLRLTVDDLETLSDFVTERVWSPCIWAGGSRGAVYFRCALWCALDFDDTLTKAEAQEALAGLSHFLAPTQNDGREKVSSTGRVKPARDRFRVLVPFKQPIWDRDVFEYNMRLAIRRFGSDPLPYDAGRVWQPSRSVDYIAGEGEALDVVLTIPVEETQAFKSEQYREKNRARANGAAWPDVVKRFYAGDVTESERNDMLFKTACFFFEAGWTVEKFRQLVTSIPAMDTHDKTESTIRSAAKRTGAQYF
jgi:hypothetical protein